MRREQNSFYDVSQTDLSVQKQQKQEWEKEKVNWKLIFINLVLVLTAGAVDYYATWLAAGRVLFEIKGARPEVAQRALKVSNINQIAAGFLPLRTRVIEKDLEMRMPPRVLPYFVKERLRVNELEQARAALPQTTSLNSKS